MMMSLVTFEILHHSIVQPPILLIQLLKLQLLKNLIVKIDGFRMFSIKIDKDLARRFLNQMVDSYPFLGNTRYLIYIQGEY